MIAKSRRIWLSIVMCALCPTLTFGGKAIDKTIDHDGVQRTYALYVPDSYDGTEAWPLVINMHGATSTAAEQMEVTNMNDVADANQFLVVYPQADGDPPLWQDNDLNGRGGNDIEFIVSMIDALENDYSVDSSKIYATGLSQGGGMSYALATEFSDRIAAMASVSGRNPLNPTPSRPLPLMLMQGTADPICPIEGCDNPVTGITILPTRDVVDAWRATNQCENGPIVTTIPDTNLDDESSVTRFDYHCLATYTTTSGETIASELVYFEIENGGHAWPGGTDHGFGPLNQDINASEVIWEFFSRHQLPLSPQGDFDGNSVLDANDVDLLAQEVRRESQRRVFDVNQDGSVTLEDHSNWVSDLRQTWIGDADLDGQFNSSDLIAAIAAGTYEADVDAGWASGDFDASGRFDSSDLIVALADGGYELGPKTAVSAVPEPATLALLLMGMMVLCRHRHNPASPGQVPKRCN